VGDGTVTTDSNAGNGRRAVVVGAGRMGHGIALELARGGFAVSLFDAAPDRAEAAIAEARQDAQDLVRAGVIAAADVDVIVGRLRAAETLADAAAGADFGAEAVAEDVEVKQDVFAELDRLCPPPAILTSNTSSISISEIAQGCAHPERVALAHWMLPPHLIPTVEIAPGASTDAATITGLRELLESIDKWPVLIRKELPGYLMNRLQFALAREALSLIDKGVTTAEEIDQLMKGVLARRIPVLGIMRQADMAGLDVYRQIFTYLGPDLDASAEPPAFLEEAVAAGHTGAREGRGLFTWEPGEFERYVAARNEALIQALRKDRAG